MINFRAFYLVLSLLSMSIFIPRDVNAQTYLPVGPQTNVPIITVTGGGWTECFRDTYGDHLDADTVLSRCTGSRLMLSCRPTGSDTLTLLAQGDRSDVTFDTGANLDVLHVANGVGWYFNTTGAGEDEVEVGASWGFVREGDSVEKGNCDTDISGANDERLCWHLQNNGGYRCGATTGLNSSDSFERIVYTSNRVPNPIPTLSEWSLISVAVGLGIIGLFFALRRRKVQFTA